MGDVREEHGVHLVGDRAEGLEVERARVGGGATLDHPGTVFQGQAANLIVVDLLGILAHAVGDDPVELSGEVDRAAVGEMTAMVEVHGEHGVAHLADSAVDRLVGL